jgi:hypothetical protein
MLMFSLKGGGAVVGGGAATDGPTSTSTTTAPPTVKPIYYDDFDYRDPRAGNAILGQPAGPLPTGTEANTASSS